MAYSPRRGANKGVRAERRVARAFKARCVGGPGQPDFIYGGKSGENKHYDARPIDAWVVRKAHRRGMQIVNASGRKGFTRGAKAAAKELGVRLTHRRR